MLARMLSTHWLWAMLAGAAVGVCGCSSTGGGCGSCSNGGAYPYSGSASAVPPPAPVAPQVGAATTTVPYGGQKTCPVMGEELGMMGEPVAVAVGGDTVYVCCQGCVAKVRSAPDRYLAKVFAERRQVMGQNQ